MRIPSLVVTTACVLAASALPAHAAEPGVTKARLALDRVEARLRGRKSLEVRAGNRHIATINGAVKSLSTCKKRDDPAFKKQLQRARDLDKRVRALIGGGAAPNPTPSADAGEPDTFTLQAKAEVDKVEAAVKTLAPGDVPAASSLIHKLMAAVKTLKRSGNRQTALWGATMNRVAALDKQIRAQAKKPKGKVKGTGEPDEVTRQAAAILDEVEAATKTLKPGMVKEANALIAKINSARTTLSKTKLRRTQLWLDSHKRAGVLDARIRKQASAPKGLELTPEAAARLKAAPTIPPMPGDEPAMSVKDRLWFAKHFGGLEKTYQGIALRDPRAFADRRAEPTQKLLQRKQAALKKLSAQTHPRTQWAAQVLETALKLLAERATEGTKLEAERLKKREAEIAAANEELKQIEAFFDVKTFNCELKAPFGAERVSEWIAKLRKYQDLAPRGTALVEKFVKENPEWERLDRVRRVRQLFTHAIPNKIKRGIERTVNWYDSGSGNRRGHMLEGSAGGENLLKLVAEQGLKEKWLKDDKWVKIRLERIDTAIDATKGLIQFKKAWEGKDAPKLAALIGQLRDLRGKLGEAAKRVLAESRMPAADSTSSSDLAMAKSLLKKKGYGPFRRLVINSAKKSRTEKKSDSRREGDYMRIWTWTEKWDQMQVCAVEQIEGEFRLVYYTLKLIHVGPPWKTTGSWYVRERGVYQRILEENIDK